MLRLTKEQFLAGRSRLSYYLRLQEGTLLFSHEKPKQEEIADFPIVIDEGTIEQLGRIFLVTSRREKRIVQKMETYKAEIPASLQEKWRTAANERRKTTQAIACILGRSDIIVPSPTLVESED